MINWGHSYKTGKWYKKCKKCKTTEIKHKAEGLCNVCYLSKYSKINVIKNREKALRWFNKNKLTKSE